MISSKDRNKILNDPDLLSGFVRQVKNAADTPWLIQWVADEAERMILCDAVVNVKKDQDKPLYNRLKAHCRNEGISFPNLQGPLQAVARSLGLVIAETQIDFYDLLEVPTDVDTDQIRKAYRQKAYDIHPDTRKDGRAETAEFISLHAAYQTLTDPELRRQYDESRRNLEIWKERRRPAGIKHKPRRLKSVYQLASVLLFFIVIAYIFDMIYRENALTTGYKPVEDSASVSKKIANILPPKKLLVAGDLSDLYLPLTSGFIKKPLHAPPPLPEIPLFPAGPEIKSSADIGARKKAGPIGKKSEIAGRSRKSEKNSLKDGRFITVFDQVQINVHGLSLRKSPRIDGKTIRKMAKGESGQVIGGPRRVDDFIWWALKLKNGDTGWASEKKVSASTQSTGEPVQMLSVVRKSNRLSGQSTSKEITKKKKEPAVVQKPPRTKILQSFLNRYSETYEKRDLKAFFRFFTADATENGKPLQELRPIYRRTFQTIDRIDYTIKLLEHAVELHTRTIHLKGGFNLKWRTITDGGEHESTGSIEMVLVQDQKRGFLVKQMNYRYRS